MGTLITVKRWLGRVGFIPGPLDVCEQCIKIIYNESRMCFARWTKIRFDAEMKLDIPRLEPCTAALRKLRRFWDLDEAQAVNIEEARPIFFAGRHSNLDMINGEYFHVNLRLCRESCIDPSGEPAQQCLDTCIAIVQKEERRTGALMFVRSGTVGDDPLVFIERHSRDISFDGAQRNGDRADCVALRKGIRAAHIYQDRRTAVECRLCFLK